MIVHFTFDNLSIDNITIDNLSILPLPGDTLMFGGQTGIQVCALEQSKNDILVCGSVAHFFEDSTLHIVYIRCVLKKDYQSSLNS